MKIAIVDYGVGNVFSLCCSLKSIGADAVITDSEKVILNADKVILPGVGAFPDAMESLKKNNLDETVLRCARSGKDILGICLGMQMLFKKSYEFGICNGLGLLNGNVVPLKGAIPDNLKVPHMGWNSIEIVKKGRLLRNTDNLSFAYFVHSYYAKDCEDSVCAVTEYGIPVTACVEKDNIMGCQFHPEKSGKTGIEILRSFCMEA